MRKKILIHLSGIHTTIPTHNLKPLVTQTHTPAHPHARYPYLLPVLSRIDSNCKPLLMIIIVGRRGWGRIVSLLLA